MSIDEPAVTSYATARNRTITAGGTVFAYRELGPRGGVPVVLFTHLAATLDNWDPRIVDPIARNRHVIAFDNVGVGGSSGTVPPTIEQSADAAHTFITALGYDEIDLFSFSMGGMIAQDLIVKHPGLVRRLVLTGTGPRGGKDMDKVLRTTYYDVLRAALTRSDPKEFLFFNRDATGKKAAKAFIARLRERTSDRDAPIRLSAFQTQLRAIQRYGRSVPSDLSVFTMPTLIANGDNDRMVPSALSNDLHRRIVGSDLVIYPDSGHGGSSSTTRSSPPSWSNSSGGEPPARDVSTGWSSSARPMRRVAASRRPAPRHEAHALIGERFAAPAFGLDA